MATQPSVLPESVAPTPPSPSSVKVTQTLETARPWAEAEGRRWRERHHSFITESSQTTAWLAVMRAAVRGEVKGTLCESSSPHVCISAENTPSGGRGRRRGRGGGGWILPLRTAANEVRLRLQRPCEDEKFLVQRRGEQQARTGSCYGAVLEERLCSR